jgi:hypothetical protein
MCELAEQQRQKEEAEEAAAKKKRAASEVGCRRYSCVNAAVVSDSDTAAGMEAIVHDKHQACVAAVERAR